MSAVGKRRFSDHADMRELAMSILERYGGERHIILQVQLLMNSPDDTLAKEEALDKLRALRSACRPPENESPESRPGATHGI